MQQTNGGAIVAPSLAFALNVPTAQGMFNGGELVYSVSNGNALDVGGFLSDADSVEISLSVTAGQLQLASTSGLTVLKGRKHLCERGHRGVGGRRQRGMDGLTYVPLANATSDTLTAEVSVVDGHGNVVQSLPRARSRFPSPHN